MREGSLDAPVRHPLNWDDPVFYDEEQLDAELRRVFDICHGCRRCFNLCDSFPRLFDLIDDSETMELDSVDSRDFKPVADACTLCDMCFMTKCPYVPPHEFNLDFPHLMLRYRAVENKAGKTRFAEGQIAKTDRNGKLAGSISGLSNWATNPGNKPTRITMEAVAGIDRAAAIPQFHGSTFVRRAGQETPAVNQSAPGFGRKAVLYATCFVNYNNPDIGVAARAVLAQNGVETEVVYPKCCGMPLLERGDLEAVSANADAVSSELVPWIEKGYDIIALIPSCALMLKFEWPLIVPKNNAVKRLAQSTFDISEYVVDIARKEGLAEGLEPLEGGVSAHLACHARAQNMGAKSVELLKLIPQTEVEAIERCSGHGGAWGIMKDNFKTAIKVGKPVAQTATRQAKAYVVSECPLAGDHILQGMERLDGGSVPDQAHHPIELLARAYGL